MIPITRPDLPDLDDYVSLLREIWSSRMLSNFGDFAKRLEGLATEYLGVPTMVVSSGDIGLTIAIAALQLPPDSTALVPSFTFNSTVNALLWNRLRPVFVDIDPVSLNMDPVATKHAAERFGPQLIVATHVFGNPADTDALTRIAEGAGAALLFDAAHGYGSLKNGVHVGNFGHAEVFSLSGTKPVTSAEGGLISSHDADFLGRVAYLRAYGFQGDYNSRYAGLNGKMSELHAALGVLTLARIEDVLDIRRNLVSRYQARFAGSRDVAVQPVAAADRSTRKDLAVLFASGYLRDAAEDRLVAAGIQVKRYFRPCHQMDAYARYAHGVLPVTEDVHSRILCLPLFQSLPLDEIDRISDVVLGRDIAHG